MVLFVSTNVDDLLVLVGFFSDRMLPRWDIVFGQYAGLSLLFLVSAAGALVSLVISPRYLALLGMIPIVIGIKKLIALRKQDGDTVPKTQGGIATVALVTIANGGDNIGVYLPAFAVHTASQIAVIAIVFTAMTALWCVLANWLVSHPTLGAPIRRYAHVLSPLVLIGLGLFILLRR